MTITGTNLSGAISVKFGDVPAPGFEVNPAGTAITVSSPAGTGLVNVTVTTVGGQSEISKKDRFRYQRPKRQKPTVRRPSRGELPSRQARGSRPAAALFVRSLERGDESMVEEVLRLSSSRRLFAPLAYLVGAFAMLLEGLRRLLRDWRVLPTRAAAGRVAVADDVRPALHVLRGSSFHSADEADLVAVAVLIVGVTAARPVPQRRVRLRRRR